MSCMGVLERAWSVVRAYKVAAEQGKEQKGACVPVKWIVKIKMLVDKKKERDLVMDARACKNSKKHGRQCCFFVK